MRNAGLDEAQAGIKIAGRNINNLRYADDTTLIAENEEELKSLLMKVQYSMDMGLGGLREFVMDREAWHAVFHGVAKSRTWLSNWTELIWSHKQCFSVSNELNLCFLSFLNIK